MCWPKPTCALFGVRIWCAHLSCQFVAWSLTVCSLVNMLYSLKFC